jgi:YVTN family beta-propeller protein
VTNIEVGNNPTGVAVTPDGKLVYITNSDDNTVSVIDTATNRVAATLAVGAGPSWGGYCSAAAGCAVQRVHRQT